MMTKTKGPYRLLIVEDDVAMLRRLTDAAMATSDFTTVDSAGTANEARKLLDQRHYHFVSVDQNLPDEEGERVGPQPGLNLVSELVDEHPLTDRRIYTGNGETQFANYTGRKDGTRYVEKRLTDDAPADHLDPEVYISEVARDLQERYIPWALRAAAPRLPGHLGGYARDAAGAWDSRDWTTASRAICSLAPAIMELAWAQTLAVAAAAGITLPPRPDGLLGREAADRETDAGVLWPKLEEAGWMSPWRRALAAGAVGGTAPYNVLNAAAEWRRVRNAMAHERQVEVGEDEFARFMPATLALIDQLAACVETPLIEAPRRHPRQRGLIQFNVVAALPPWELREARDEYDLIREGQSYFIRWVGPDGPLLLDLYPFVLRPRSGPRHEPFALMSAKRETDGRISRADYRSLIRSDQRSFIEAEHRKLLEDLTKSLGG